MSFLSSLISDVLPMASEIIGGIFGGAAGAELAGMLGRLVSNMITGSSNDVTQGSNLPPSAQQIFGSNYVQSFESAGA